MEELPQKSVHLGLIAVVYGVADDASGLQRLQIVDVPAGRERVSERADKAHPLHTISLSLTLSHSLTLAVRSPHVRAHTHVSRCSSNSSLFAGSHAHTAHTFTCTHTHATRIHNHTDTHINSTHTRASTTTYTNTRTHTDTAGNNAPHALIEVDELLGVVHEARVLVRQRHVA